MVGEKGNRWKDSLLIASCLVIPLLALVLLIGAAAMEMDPMRREVDRNISSQANVAVDRFASHKKSRKIPATIKIHSWVDVLRIFYFDIFLPDSAPNVMPFLPEMLKDERFSKPQVGIHKAT